MKDSKTHEVLNQPPPLVSYNLYTTDEVLKEAVRREGAGWAEEKLARYGDRIGSEEVIRWGFQANENPPVLKTHDRFGNRIDEVEYHPAWHELMRLTMEYGLHSSPWAEPKEGAHVARAALMMLDSQNEFGHLCPISMTYAVLPSLRKQPELAAEWEPKIYSTTYDPSFRPVAEKRSATLGMAMTEKQGGSDVRANTTRAEPVGKGGPGAEYRITGHKWFCSAPMSDAFLVLAQTSRGLSCFLLPRWTPDGNRNRFFIQRLKDKLGNRSNASSEVEFDGAWARMVGEEGRGVATIVEMVNHTRLDCVIGSTALMRQAAVQAIHHASYRSTFGRRLIEQPLMQNVLADLCVESEAATLLMMRLARAYDRKDDQDFESPFRRIATAVSKYWVCKRAPSHVYEALECLGGNGFVEESILPRIYREAPLNSIWEGSGNVICLDVFRAMGKEPKTLEAFAQEIRKGKGAAPRLDAYLKTLEGEISKGAYQEVQARRLVEKMALALQASLLVRHGHPSVTEAFLASRLSGDWGSAFGTLPDGIDFKTILERARPKVG
jgi:putative acyl-CoA dehydrogenase